MTAVEDEIDLVALERTFRAAMGSIVAAVSVVTAVDDDGPYGTTVSAFGSLSLDPPMMFVSLDNRSTLLSRLRVGASAAVNVLAAHHDQVALRFARRAVDKFADLSWSLVHGAPALDDRHALVSLRVAQLVPGGDHTLVLADVVAAEVEPNAPLSYWRRSFGTHQSF